LFSKLISTLATAALCIGASAGLASLAFAEGEEQPDLARGEQLFVLCQQCHGTNGGGNAVALAPAIAGMPSWYIDGQLVKFKTGLRGLNAHDTGGLRMYPMSQWLRSEADQKAVAAYVASLPAIDPTPNPKFVGNAEMGQGFYAVCSACHGPDGKGNQAMGAPPLVGLNDWYLYSAIQKYKAGIRGSIPGDALGPVMIGMVATLPSDDAVRDVIAHIQALE
jgi:cytochrome c oxidase subunit 2